VKKDNLDNRKPKKRQHRRDTNSLKELREAIDKAHRRMIGVQPFFEKKFNYGKKDNEHR
jgi:hypothetical protein